MGRRSRQRGRSGGGGSGGEGPSSAAAAPTAAYRDPEGNELVLRGSLTPSSRREFASVLQGGLNQEDAWQRAVEFLFERLAVSWTISGLALERQRELLGRYRMADAGERAWIRSVLREHLAEHFPDVHAP